MAGLQRELVQRNTDSPSPIFISYRSRNVLDMTIIDTPGLDPNPESKEWAMVESIIRNDHPELLIVDECGNKTSFTSTIADRLQIRLEESSSASLYFFWSLAGMNSHGDLNKLFMAPTGHHFILTLPSSGTYEDGDLTTRVLQANSRDQFAIREIDHRPPPGVGVGFAPLKRHINNFAVGYYQEKVVPALREAMSVLKADLQNQAESSRGLSVTPLTS